MKLPAVSRHDMMTKYYCAGLAAKQSLNPTTSESNLDGMQMIYNQKLCFYLLRADALANSLLNPTAYTVRVF